MPRALHIAGTAAAAAVAMLALPCAVSAASSVSVQGVVPIADQLSVRATNIATAEGASISGPIATFTDSNTAQTAGAFTATVTWGDGHATGGTVSGGAGSFSITATHVYAEEGSYAISVLVQQVPSGSHASAGGTATIADAALTATGMRPSTSKTVHTVVATFSDADPGGAAADYTASIRWGDGTTTTGTIAPSGTGFSVTGSHTYRRSGTFTIAVAITDAGGAHTSATTTLVVRGS
jgi:hypothetical protein